jgi:hypothetical protein
MRRTLKAALAGMTAAGVWIAAEPALRRMVDGPHQELRLIGRMLAPERSWKRVGLAVHLMNGAMFGIAFDRLGGRGVRQGVIVAQIENTVLWPTMLIVDRLHPDVRDGTWPPLARDRRVIAQEVAAHVVFGAVLGAILSN